MPAIATNVAVNSPKLLIKLMNINNEYTKIYKQAMSIYLDALRLAKKDQRQFIQDACAGNTQLEQTCERLLDNQCGELTFENEFFQREDVTEALDSLIGEAIGNYRINELIGSGGMADVYSASRIDGVHSNTVALKLVRGWGTLSDLVQRFNQERKILARLTHPNIALFLDGGVSKAGRPYFVMEFVEGRWIHDYCKQNTLNLEARLGLFLEVCSAVAHAHQQLVIHRDIKPSNILVSKDGKVKLLDFGIAKLLDKEPENHETTVGLPLTPSYCSPEQVQKQHLGTASDQYSLGVLLYELLTEQSPYAKSGSTDKSQINIETLRQVCEETPVSLSTAASGNTALCVSHRGQYIQKLGGDIEAIVKKTLEKDPINRYTSVQHLAEDIQRFLDRKPVSAKNGSWLYFTSKFMFRHWKVIATACVLVLFFSFQQYRLVKQKQALMVERDIAEKRTLESQQVQEFLSEMFVSSDPDVAQGKDFSASEMLERGVSKLKAGLADQPLVKAELLHTLGLVYYSRGQYPNAIDLLQQSVEIKKVFTSDNSDSMALTLLELGEALRNNGDYKAARSALIEAEEILVTLSRNHIGLSKVYSTLAGLYWYQNDLEKSIYYLEKARDIVTNVDAGYGEAGQNEFSGAAELSQIYYRLGIAYEELEELDKSLYFYNLAIEQLAHEGGEKSQTAAKIYFNFGLFYRGRGDYDQALIYLEKAKEVNLYLFDEPNHFLAVIYRGFSSVSIAMENYREANNAILKSIEILEVAVQENHPDMLLALLVYAENQASLNYFDNAIASVDKTIEMLFKYFKEPHVYFFNFYELKGDILVMRGDDVAGKEYYLKAYENTVNHKDGLKKEIDELLKKIASL